MQEKMQEERQVKRREERREKREDERQDKRREKREEGQAWRCLEKQFSAKLARWTDGRDSTAGKDKVRNDVQRVSVPGESRKDGKKEVAVASGQADCKKEITQMRTANHSSTKVTAHRLWVPVEGVANQTWGPSDEQVEVKSVLKMMVLEHLLNKSGACKSPVEGMEDSGRQSRFPKHGSSTEQYRRTSNAMERRHNREK